MRVQAGFSLLELLIASALLATALLGLGALAARGLMDAAGTRDHTLASVMLDDLEGRVTLTGGPASYEPMAPEAQQELEAWRHQLDQLLPGASFELCRNRSLDRDPTDDRSCDGSGPLKLTLRWPDRLSAEGYSRALVLSP